MPLPEGTVVDNRYVILHQLGVGGMGTVYKANDRELDRTVALKVIHVELIANEDARKRFAREGRVLASIHTRMY